MPDNYDKNLGVNEALGWVTYHQPPSTLIICSNTSGNLVISNWNSPYCKNKWSYHVLTKYNKWQRNKILPKTY